MANTSLPTLNRGDKVGHYVIAEQIGAGGASIVYRAHDPLLNKDVAVKQLRLGTGEEDEAARQRVKAEAAHQKQAAAADAKHLVQYIETIDDPRGLLLVSEYVAGPSLEQILAQNTGQMDLKQALGIMAAVAKALDAIHRQGMLHRDLKPANILLPRAGGLKVADFGLATAISEQQIMAVGSVRYMAPELLRGEQADGRADLYALGMIAYEMIAGRAKFDEAFRTVLRDQRNQAMRWMKWHTNPRVQARPVGELVPDLPDAVSELVGRLMAKDPASRVPTAADVVDAIQRHFVGNNANQTAQSKTQSHHGSAGTAHVAASQAGDTAALPKRSKWPWIAAGAVAAVVIVAAIVGISSMQQVSAEQLARQQAAQQTLDEAREAYREQDYARAMQGYEQVAENWPAETSLGKSAAAGVLLSQGQLHMLEAKYDAARKAFGELDAMDVMDRDLIRQLMEEAEHRAAFASAMTEITRQVNAGQFVEARQELRNWRELTLTAAEETQLRELAARLEDQVTQRKHEQILARANELVAQGRRPGAIALLEAALKNFPSPRIQQRYDELMGVQTYQDVVAAARAAQEAGDLAGAIQAYQRAQQLQQDADIARTLNDLRGQQALQEGLQLLSEGKTEAAQAALTRSLRYRESQQARDALAQLASSHRRSGFIADGDQATATGDYEAAITQYQNALALGQTSDVQDKLRSAQVNHFIQQANAAANQGNLDDAHRLLRQAQQLAPSNTQVNLALTQIDVRRQYHQYLAAGDDARQRSDFGDAKRQYRRALQTLETDEVHRRLDDTEYAHLIAQARSYIANEEYASAKALLLSASQMRPSEQVRDMIAEVDKLAQSSEE